MTLPFDPAEYESPVYAPLVDTFTKQNKDGSFTAGITRESLPHWERAANERHQRGEHCPLVIGHTVDGAVEVDQPPKVGWITGPYKAVESHPNVVGPCLLGLHHVRKESTLALNGVAIKLSARELLDRFPRRSAELWFSDYKIDPVALLGATTPCRELGALRLDSRAGIVVNHESPTRLALKDTTPMPTPAETDDKKEKGPDTDHAGYKQLEAVVQQLAQQVAALGEMQAQMHEAMQAQSQGAPGDEDLEALLNHHLGGAGQGEPTPEAPTPKDKPDAKMSRDPEKDELLAKVARHETAAKLAKLESQGISFGFVDQADRDAFLLDLQAMSPSIQDAVVLRLQRTRSVPAASPDLQTALTHAAKVAGGVKPLTKADEPRLMKLARERGHSFTQVAKDEGYETALTPAR